MLTQSGIRKHLKLVTVFLLLTTILAGCGGQPAPANTPTTSSPEATATTATGGGETAATATTSGGTTSNTDISGKLTVWGWESTM